MEVSCLQQNLSRALAIVGRAVATRSNLPVLQNVKIATEEGMLVLTATNLDIAIQQISTVLILTSFLPYQPLMKVQQ